jgi:hypothetical protein
MENKEYRQIPRAIFMVRPTSFGYNAETAQSNAFQHKAAPDEAGKIQELARNEFDAFVTKLRDKGIEVLVFEQENEKTPDAIFPNNWVSFHNDGKVVLYPMLAKNRRLERRQDIIDAVQEKFEVKEIIDLSPNEELDAILEGTGSIIFDHVNHVAYANESPRTHKELFNAFCKQIRYEPVLFTAKDKNGVDIYHTNVLMALGDRYAVICLASIPEKERGMVTDKLQQTGRQIVDITFEQMGHFAGNMLQVAAKNGSKFLVMSKRAFDSLTIEQKTTLGKYNELLYADLETIEDYGGGSARCMIAGIHLPLNA